VGLGSLFAWPTTKRIADHLAEETSARTAALDLGFQCRNYERWLGTLKESLDGALIPHRE
jgi:hypothetical protein